MAFCKKCGTQITDGVSACQACGEPTAFTPPQGAYMTPEQDALDNKANGVLAYFGPLVLVPILSEKGKRSPFARFHANQGLVLLLLDVAFMIVGWILGAIFAPKTIMDLYTYATGGFTAVTVIWWVIWLIVAVFSIIGIVNAVGGKMKPLPIIGGIKLLK